MKLYSYFRSSCSYRVRIALNLKKIDYEVRPVHLVKDGGEQFHKEYAQINPGHIVPSLQDGEMIVTQSMAIIEYIAARYKGHNAEVSLFGETVNEATRIREICEVINSGIQPIQNLSVNKYLMAQHDLSDEQKNQWNHHWIERGFVSLEKYLEKHSGRYCIDDQITAADCFLIPQVYNARRFNVDLSQFPKIQSIDAHCMELDEFVQASPENQPDTPK